MLFISRLCRTVLPALKQIREICCLYTEAPPNFPMGQTTTGQARSNHAHYRHEVISRLQNEHSLVILVSENLSTYINRARINIRNITTSDPNVISPGSRFSHVQEVQERLNFLRFLLKDGQLWVCRAVVSYHILSNHFNSSCISCVHLKQNRSGSVWQKIQCTPRIGTRVSNGSLS